MTGARFVPFAVPTLGDSERAAVNRVISSGWLSTGEEAAAFETEFAEMLGVTHAVALNSCTAALHLALVAANIGVGDEVIVPTVTFTATAAAVVHAGATPVLADVEPSDLTLGPDQVDAVRTERTKAVIAVHFAGRMADMAKLRALCEAHSLLLIEDAAHTLPATRDGANAGTVGDVSAFSFFATKPITTAEGGMLATNNARIADEARCWSLHGLSRGAADRYRPRGRSHYDVDRPGFKYNMSDLAASLGRAQLQRSGELMDSRRAIADLYIRHLSAVPGLELPRADTSTDRSSWYLFPIRLRTDQLRLDRDDIRDRLGEAGVGTSIHFQPLHTFTWYASNVVRAWQRFPNADEAFPQLVSLPIYPTMTADDIQYVVEAVGNVLSDAAA
ncbi:DegT/DnrJ/EryC1/StrS family aminotransferase [Rhodococcus sp. 06-235-1A]|uniref:DegT/DnrJ/EryC1/StrS family aminotransferase n=1 Tax=Rhodococcus sp. 06-235-1A TaxID=2022508 RepID=UPI0026C6EF18|nr:DegT/DnrJ/EryC1/StrS aminotransferase family protein [Rhodococcus sp. 06-235-1A]